MVTEITTAQELALSNYLINQVLSGNREQVPEPLLESYDGLNEELATVFSNYLYNHYSMLQSNMSGITDPSTTMEKYSAKQKERAEEDDGFA